MTNPDRVAHSEPTASEGQVLHPGVGWGSPREPLTCVMALMFFPVFVRASLSTRGLRGGVAILSGYRTLLSLPPSFDSREPLTTSSLCRVKTLTGDRAELTQCHAMRLTALPAPLRNAGRSLQGEATGRKAGMTGWGKFIYLGFRWVSVSGQWPRDTEAIALGDTSCFNLASHALCL